MTKGLVLVIGVNGFVGIEVALAFLDAGFHVRGTARSEAKAKDWIKSFPQHKDHYEAVVVNDLTDENQINNAVKGVDFVVHTASPLPTDVISNVEDNEKNFLIPIIKGTQTVLKVASKNPSVKHVVYTSSLVTSITLGDSNPNKMHNSDTWSEHTYEDGKNSNVPPIPYFVGKKYAEKAVLDFIKNEKPSFSVTTLCPPYVYGPPSQPINSVKDLNVSSQLLYKIISGEVKEVGPEFSPLMIDVRDLATAHLRAVEKYQTTSKNRRFILVAHEYTPEDILKVAHKQFPQIAHRLPRRNDEPVICIKYDITDVKEALGLEFIPKEKTFSDSIAKYLEIEQKSK